MDDDAFDAVSEALDPQMYIVTVSVGEAQGGCLVGFGSQCSMHPPRFMVWISKLNHTYDLAQSASFIAVHFPRVHDEPLARHFGAETGDEVDKFADVDWYPAPNGSPAIAGLTWFEGRVLRRVDGGDHTGLLLAPEHSAEVNRDAPVLRLHHVRDIEAGHPVN
jgi:flavin reductase (DIM6/NTAB) family NADH-FMN oxidoreductase RutF